MPKVGSKKNGGYGGKMKVAVHNAMREKMKGSNTITTHTARFDYAARFFKANGYNDISKMDRRAMEQFAGHVREQVDRGNISVSYGKNLISSANQGTKAVRGSADLTIKPSDYLPQRSQVRDNPVNTSKTSVDSAAANLYERDQDRNAVSIRSMREFGLRVREASQLNYQDKLREAERHGAINIVDGTKGNRGEHCDRWVPVTDRGMDILREGAQLQGERNNLMEQDESFKDFVNDLKDARGELKDEGIGRIHDLRAAYAADRYEAITGYTAPVNRGPDDERAPAAVDRAARDQLSGELGHGRRDVVSAYVGSR